MFTKGKADPVQSPVIERVLAGYPADAIRAKEFFSHSSQILCGEETSPQFYHCNCCQRRSRIEPAKM
jgi:hypothetical protein